MRQSLLLSSPCINDEKFQRYLSKWLNSNAIVFIVAYASEPIMMQLRFNKDPDVNIRLAHLESLKQDIVLFGVQEDNIILSNDDDTRTDFLDKFSRSTVTIFCGGASETLIEKIEELNVLDLIRKTEKPIIGFSAGAEILLNNIILLPSTFWENAGNYYSKLSSRKAVGRVENLSLTFHYRNSRDSFIQAAADGIYKTIYAIADGEGVYVEDNRINWVGTPIIFYPANRV